MPEFWDWLIDRGTSQQVKIPMEMYEEILGGKEDGLTRWLKDNRDAVLFQESAEATLVARVTEQGYARDLSEEEIERVGRDPFLIAYAYRDLGRRTVVTTEVSRPKKAARESAHPGRVRCSGRASLQHPTSFGALDSPTQGRR